MVAYLHSSAVFKNGGLYSECGERLAEWRYRSRIPEGRTFEAWTISSPQKDYAWKYRRTRSSVERRRISSSYALIKEEYVSSQERPDVLVEVRKSFKSNARSLLLFLWERLAKLSQPGTSKTVW